jgi:predicted hydrocarbon binding protein
MDSETKQKCRSLLEKTEYYDDEGEWRIAGSDCLLLNGATLRAWAEFTKQVLGPGAKVIMSEAGKSAGQQFARSLLKVGLKLEELKDAAQIFLTQSGWGMVSAQVDTKKKSATFQIRNSVMARQIKSQEPVCHFIAGYLAGVLSVMLNENVECNEETCGGMGDNLCEFQAVWR